ncbi:MAG: hypothetical protein AABX51_06485, partial [Nanoarchaeota archaeon]
YDKKCSDILNRLNEAEDLNELKTAVFNLAKDEPILNLIYVFNNTCRLKKFIQYPNSPNINSPFQYIAFLSQRTVRRRKPVFNQEIVLSTTQRCFSR